MHTTKKVPAGDGSPKAGYSGAATVAPTGATVAATQKEFAALQAAFALRGHALQRRGGAEGFGELYAVRWGLVRDLPTLDDARSFLEQIGGKP